MGVGGGAPEVNVNNLVYTKRQKQMHANSTHETTYPHHRLVFERTLVMSPPWTGVELKQGVPPVLERCANDSSDCNYFLEHLKKTFSEFLEPSGNFNVLNVNY